MFGTLTNNFTGPAKPITRVVEQHDNLEWDQTVLRQVCHISLVEIKNEQLLTAGIGAEVQFIAFYS